MSALAIKAREEQMFSSLPAAAAELLAAAAELLAAVVVVRSCLARAEEARAGKAFRPRGATRPRAKGLPALKAA
jgi:hypothetical protein